MLYFLASNESHDAMLMGADAVKRALPLGASGRWAARGASRRGAAGVHEAAAATPARSSSRCCPIWGC